MSPISGRRLLYPSCCVFEEDVGGEAGVYRGGQVGAEADAYVEGAVEVEGERGAELVHGLALEADKDGELVTALLDADALGEHVGELAAEAVGHVRHLRAFVCAPCDVSHAGAVLGDYGFFGVVVEALADDEDDFAVVVSL